jgi:hypothetical protein
LLQFKLHQWPLIWHKALRKSRSSLSRLQQQGQILLSSRKFHSCSSLLYRALFFLVVLIQSREGFLSAYPWRYAFDATIGSREPRGRRWYAKYYASAISLSSTEFEVVKKVAADNKIFLSVGIIERDEEGGATLYCTSVLIGRNGELLSSHRKV